MTKEDVSAFNKSLDRLRISSSDFLIELYWNLKNFAMDTFQNILDFIAAISEKAEFYSVHMKYPEELRKLFPQTPLYV